jgi:hypothetical protein
MFSFSSQATIEPSSQQTLVLADDEMGSDPSLPVAQVAAEADLFSDSKFVCTACDGRDARMFQLRPCNVSLVGVR